MKFTKSVSVEELQVIGRFESLRKLLLSERYADHLKKPLAYWALPTDRRLPLAFLGRTLEDLFQISFRELSNTPGVGQKKICAFVKLLARVANTDPSELPTDSVSLSDAETKAEGKGELAGGFDVDSVSEVVWGQWRASVIKHGLGDEKLGRLAPTLRNMTRVIWNTPLGAYTQFNLGKIRSMKTHGEKRVHAILEVFHSVHSLVANMGTQDHLVVRIFPKLVDQVERWIGNTLQTAGVSTTRELFENVIRPLLEQVRTDSTQQIASLAENRLGISAPITSVRQVARGMGLTRARVYQLLNEINDIMAVRWPDGRHQMYELREKLTSESTRMDSQPNLQQFFAAIELFYPGSRRGAAGPLEHLLDEEDDEETTETMAEDRSLVEAK
ncbi:MAG: hypothetical protein WCJ35_17855 [Planctomycetota bacterium]